MTEKRFEIQPNVQTKPLREWRVRSVPLITRVKLRLLAVGYGLPVGKVLTRIVDEAFSKADVKVKPGYRRRINRVFRHYRGVKQALIEEETRIDD